MIKTSPVIKFSGAIVNFTNLFIKLSDTLVRINHFFTGLLGEDIVDAIGGYYCSTIMFRFVLPVHIHKQLINSMLFRCLNIV